MPQQGGQCPFCQLIDNPEQLLTVGETDNFYAWLEVNPRAKGHTMIVPKEHKENVLEFSGEEWTEAFRLTREVVEKAKQGLNADGASITVNIEEAGGQMLPHAYIQVFPRFQEDENAGTPTGAIFPQREELQQQLESIQNDMSGISFDFGGEVHEPHPEGQRFKDDDNIGGLLTDKMGSSDSSEEEKEFETEDEESESDSDKETMDEIEVNEMSDSKVLKMMINRHGGAEEFLECDAMKRLLKEYEKKIIDNRMRKRKSSFDWQ